jgi:5-methylcytosine-specific restriction protein A
MNRKTFIESHGATCNNWTWSWSFVNEKEKFVIFGAWDIHQNGNTTLILSDKWEVSRKGRKQPGYAQSLEHIRLVSDHGYQLKTFPMVYSDDNRDGEEDGPAKIGDFVPTLSNKSLKHVAGNWYASDDVISVAIPEEIESPERYTEGASKLIAVNTYERSAEARAQCIAHHGYTCAACEFDFEKVYGDIGQHFIHVHHIVPLSDIRKQYTCDPIHDLIPVCPNCHAIIHRTQPPLTIDELKNHLKRIGR